MGHTLRLLGLLPLLALAAAFVTGCGERPQTATSAGSTGRSTGPVAEKPPAPPVVRSAKDKGSDSHNAPNQVVIDNFTFNPRSLTVKAGTNVTWVNRDDVPHTATSTKKPRLFDSGALDTDEKFSHVFTAPGTYDYFCAVHPQMTGKIMVK
jgi:plastocyanin